MVGQLLSLRLSWGHQGVTCALTGACFLDIVSAPSRNCELTTVSSLLFGAEAEGETFRTIHCASEAELVTRGVVVLSSGERKEGVMPFSILLIDDNVELIELLAQSLRILRKGTRRSSQRMA